MIRINLLPREERVATRRVALPRLGALAPLAALVAAVAVIGGFALFEQARLASLRKDVAQLREEVRSIQPQVDRVRRLTTQREELERRLDIIRQLDQDRFLSVRIMDNASREVPNYMWLAGLTQEGNSRVTITGVTFSNLIVADFMMRLERSPLFTNVDLAKSARGQIEDRDVMEFSLSADLTPDEVPADLNAQAFLDADPEARN
jgi:type IV pilus assembly protein PilN